MPRTTPSYVGLRPASDAASRIHSRSSNKSDTKCEQLLRAALWARGLRYRKNVSTLPGKPDIVFAKVRLVVFCDGDFWHGKDWEQRRTKLAVGTNPSYWVKKIETNMARDARNTRALEEQGWVVLRFWESEIRQDVSSIVETLVIASEAPAT